MNKLYIKPLAVYLHNVPEGKKISKNEFCKQEEQLFKHTGK